MPTDERSPHNKSHKKEKKRLKRIHGGTEEPSDPFEGKPSKPEGSTLEGAMVGNSPVPNDKSTMPQSTVTSVAKTDDSRYNLGPNFEPVQVEPALDCSDYDAETHELWLLQLPMDWRFDEEASISMEEGSGGACAGHYVDAKGIRFVLREEDASLAAPMYIATASHQGGNLRCRRRITVVRDHSTKHEPKHEPADIQAGQETAPATPVAASKKRRKGIQAETPSKALGRDTGVQLQLDDILAAEASPTGKHEKPSVETPREKTKRKQKQV